MTVNNDSPVDKLKSQNNPFLDMPALDHVDQQASQAAQNALQNAEKYADLFSHNPFENTTVTDQTDLGTNPFEDMPPLPQTPHEEEVVNTELPALPDTPQATKTASKSLPSLPEQIAFPKGEKARGEFLVKLRDPNTKMGVQTMLALHKAAEAKQSDSDGTVFGKMRSVAKNVLFGKRESQLNEIKEVLVGRINAERKTEGKYSLNNLIEHLNADAGFKEDRYAFFGDARSDAPSNWMKGIRNESEWKEMYSREKSLVLFGLMRENVSLGKDEINLKSDDLEGGKLKDDVGARLRDQLYQNKPERKQVFQFLSKMQKEHGLETAHLVRLGGPSFIYPGTGPDRQSVDLKLFEWLLENPE